MKWFLVVVAVLNVVVAVYGMLKQSPASQIGAQDTNAAQLTVLPSGWMPPQPSAPLEASAVTTLPAKLDASSVPAASQPVAITPLKPGKAMTASASLAALPPAIASAAAPTKAKPEPVAVAKQCLSWGVLDIKQLERVQGGLPALQLATVPQSSVKEEARGSGRVWVFYPPLATQAETQTLVLELKGKGFDSYIVRTDGPFKGHLSLGLFTREAAAQELVKKLKAAGYTKAAIDARSTPVKLTTLTFTKLDDASADKLKALQKRLLPGIPLEGC